MADLNATTCAACGATGELHEHHLIPRADNGSGLPTIWLCLLCHGRVHGRRFHHNHRDLTIAGLRRARASGIKLGNSRRDGVAVIAAAQAAAKYAEEAAVQARLASDRAARWAELLADSAKAIETAVKQAAERAAIDLPKRLVRAQNATKARRAKARRRAEELLPYIEAARAAGCKTLTQIAEALVARGIKTPGGCSNWSAEQVRRVMVRA